MVIESKRGLVKRSTFLNSIIEKELQPDKRMQRSGMMINVVSNRERLNQIQDIIRGLQGSNGHGAHLMDIISKGSEHNILRDQVVTDLQQLKAACEIIEARTGFFQVVV